MKWKCIRKISKQLILSKHSAEVCLASSSTDFQKQGQPSPKFCLAMKHTNMGRVNKTIEGVFTNIVGTSAEISSYHQFINNGKKNNSNELNELSEMYKKMVIKHKTTFEQLAALEEIIMQMRIREDLSDIKLSLVREYIYARTPFYRKDKKAKDVRVIVDKVEFQPEVQDSGVEKLLGNIEFMAKAKEKLGVAMDNEIHENLRLWKENMKTK